jgi:long-chain acyl-CoA synthetase
MLKAMAIVPLILDRIVKGINDKVRNEGLVKRTLFSYFLEYKRKWHRRGYKTPLTDRVVFKKVAEIMGGNMRAVISGGRWSIQYRS